LQGKRLLKYVIEGKIGRKIEYGEGEEDDVTSYSMTLKNKRIQEIKRESTRWHSVEKAPWKRLWTCREADNGMSE
jgi:hypothetical protein